MHASVVPRRRPSHHRFLNHTPRPHEARDPGRSRLSSKMLGPSGVAGPVMAPLAAQIEPENPRSTNSEPIALAGDENSSISSQAQGPVVSTASTVTSSQQDSAVPPLATNPPVQQLQSHKRQEPYIDEMMTQTNLLVLPPSNPSYQMAYFLKTTGPSGEPVQKSKHKRISSAMRLFRSSTTRRPSEHLTTAHQRLNDALAGGSSLTASTSKPETKLPGGVVQKVSKTGKKYFHIEQDRPTEFPAESGPSHNILESRIEVIFDRASTDNLSNWLLAFDGNKLHDGAHSGKQDEQPALLGEEKVSNKVSAESTVRILDANDLTPLRRAATAPPTPEPDSGVDVGSGDIYELDAKVAPLRSHPVMGDERSVPPPVLEEERNVRVHETLPAMQSLRPPLLPEPGSADPLKSPQLAHPTPRRVGSHPILRQRPVSEATVLEWDEKPELGPETAGSDIDPGPPPPRSPLRVTGQPRHQSIERVIASSRYRLDAPSPEDVRTRALANDDLRTRNMDTTSSSDDLTALPQFEKNPTPTPNPKKRARTRAAPVVRHEPLSIARVRSRYYNTSSRPVVALPITKPATSSPPRRKLRRAPPEGPRPLSLERIRSQRSSLHVPGTSCGGQAFKKTSVVTPVIPKGEIVRTVHLTTEIASRTGNSRRPPNAPLREKKSPTSRTSLPCQSRYSHVAEAETRSATPETRTVMDEKEVVVLPTPPPTKELPPTPHQQAHPRAQSTRVNIDAALARSHSIRDKALPSPPREFPTPPSSAKAQAPQRAATHREAETSNERGRGSAPLPSAPSSASSSPAKANMSGLEARLAAVERRNRLLEAALTAVLKTSGMLNGCPCHLEAGGDEHVCSQQEGHKQHKPQESTSSCSKDVLDIFKETRARN